MDKKIWMDGIMGLVIGDACGVPVEFQSRLALKNDPVVDMGEYGTHHQPRGTWSDDSSMALATLASLHHGFNLKDIADRFVRWNREEIYTPFGEVFDMGITCENAIQRYQESGDPSTCGADREQDNGNGSLMRILPVCIYACDLVNHRKIDEEAALAMVHEVSALSHAHLRSKMACGLFYFCVKNILNHKEKRWISECLQQGFDEGFEWYRNDLVNLMEIEKFKRLTDLHAFAKANEDSIRSSGYVLDSLEASIWCLVNSDSYETAVLRAVNLGDDTDTVGAITGGLAGLYYGYDNIPMEWRECVIQKNWILELCDFNKEKAKEYKGPVVDNHCHLLPGIDDGATDVDMFLEMLRVAKQDGVTDMVLTSHGDQVSADLQYYEDTFGQMKELVEKERILVDIYSGCEIFCELSACDGSKDEEDVRQIVSKIREGKYPTYNGTKYTLIEFSPMVTIDEALIIVNGIIEAGYVPVLAHMERYPYLLKGNFVDAFIALGCKIQINAYSLVDEKSTVIKQGARFLLGKGVVSFLGSDAHKTNHRPPRMSSGIQYIWETCDEEYAKDIIYRNSYKYFLGKQF